MVVHNHKKFHYKDGYTDETAYEYLNSKHKLELPVEFLTYLTEIIYAQYPYIKKAHVAIIIKTYFEEFRKAFLTNNIVKIDDSIKYMFIGYKPLNNQYAKYCMVTKSDIVDKLKVTYRRKELLTNKKAYDAKSHAKYWRKVRPRKKDSKKPKSNKYWKERYAAYKRLDKKKKKLLKQALWGLAVLKKLVKRNRPPVY